MDVFEQMAIQEVRRGLTPPTIGTAQPLPWMQIELFVPFAARLLVGCPDALIREIAETAFCGVEIPGDVDVCADARAEIPNTIAGTFLSYVESNDVGIEVGVPERVAHPPPIHPGQGYAPLCDEGAALPSWACAHALYTLDDGTWFVVHVVETLP